VAAFKNYTDDAKQEQSSKPTETKKQEAAKPQQSGPQKSYPKHKKLTMPALSPTMTKGKIVEWTKKEGDQINSGDVLASVETDKAAVDFETNDEGYLAKILYPKGSSDIPLGTIIAVVVDDQKDVAAFKDYDPNAAATSAPSKQAPSEQKTEQKKGQPQSTHTETKRSGERVFVSPLAKKVAEEKGINLNEIQGSGPNGRIIEADVLEYKPSGKRAVEKPSEHVTKEHAMPQQTSDLLAQQYEDLELSSVRKVIAERLLFSKTNIPHFYLNIECNVDKLLTLRAELNKHSSVKLSINDIIIKAASLACIKVPETNSSWQGNFIRKYKNVDMCVAVQTDYGLITPIISNSNLKGLADISKEMKDLAERAKQRKLKPNEFQGGTFTISNLGMMGITNFSAIINPPQVIICS
jgi:pyruvate dehydrogenase E2 component (dihydrolipoamide acetyltransferase)